MPVSPMEVILKNINLRRIRVDCDDDRVIGGPELSGVFPHEELIDGNRKNNALMERFDFWPSAMAG